MTAEPQLPASRLNAVRHGLCATTPVIPGFESPADWEHHRASTLERLAPADYLEEALAERVALILWRLGRVARYERHVTAHAQADAQADVVDEHEAGRVEQVRATFVGIRGRLRAFDRFRQRAADAPLAGKDAEHVIAAVKQEVDAVDLDSVDLPGIVGSHDRLADLPGWTIARVLICIDAIAQAAGRAPDDLVAAAIATARAHHNRARVAYRAVERQVRQLRRERILPQTTGLEHAIRYEKHLTRQLELALAQLQRLQHARHDAAARSQAHLRAIGADHLPPALADLAVALRQYPLSVADVVALLEGPVRLALAELQAHQAAHLCSPGHASPTGLPLPRNPLSGTHDHDSCETAPLSALASPSQPLAHDGTGTPRCPS